MFGGHVTAADGVHSFGFSSGFDCTNQIHPLGLNCSNDFAYLDAKFGIIQGGGTPEFTLVGPGLGTALLGLVGLARRSGSR
jgi:hypothetical protein